MKTQTETKHTPGTLKSLRNEVFGYHEASGGPARVAKCSTDSYATLFASAPELLAALEANLPESLALPFDEYIQRFGHSHEHAPEAARAAIARAKGEQK